MNSVLKVGLVVVMGLALGGCSVIRSKTNACHNKQPYMSASSVASLRIPPGLDVPDTTNALHIPDLKDPAPPARKGKDPCLDEPPAYKVAKPTPPQA
jgi:uncharacterized lipoprotein